MPSTTVNDIHAIGLLAARPAASTANKGYLYFATNVEGGTIYRSNGSTWVQFGTGTTPPIADGTITSAKFDNVTTKEYVEDNVAALIDDSSTISWVYTDGTPSLVGSVVAGSITDSHIAADSVGTSELQNDAVETANILDNAVTQAKMADNSVGTAEILDGNVTAAKIANRIRHLFIRPQDFTIADGTPALGVVVAAAAIGWSFDPGATFEGVGTHFIVPEDYVSGAITVKLYWTNTSVNTGDVVWEVLLKNTADTATLDATGLTSGGDVVAAPVSSALKITTHTISFTPTAGRLGYLGVRRRGDNGSDTLNGNDAFLLLVEFEYTADS